MWLCFMVQTVDTQEKPTTVQKPQFEIYGFMKSSISISELPGLVVLSFFVSYQGTLLQIRNKYGVFSVCFSSCAKYRGTGKEK